MGWLSKLRSREQARSKAKLAKRVKEGEARQLKNPASRKQLREKAKDPTFGSKEERGKLQKAGVTPKDVKTTPGGGPEYEVHAKGALKKAKAAGEIKQTFGEAFKSNCKGKAADHTFSWTSPSGKKNSYSCKKA